METKQKVYNLLQNHVGEILSGEEIANMIGLSRAAVWKAVQSLRQDGIFIQSESGKGYFLEKADTTLNENSLLYHFNKYEMPNPPLKFFKTISSTNLEAKQWALSGASHGSIVVAYEQSGGKGRIGRAFSSPPGGIYMSIILRPTCSLQDASFVTQATAVAVCQSIEEQCKISLQIKWVNDLFFNQKKCCGILTEAGTHFENQTLDYLVVGIGLNFETPLNVFPENLSPFVTSLFPNGNAPISSAEQIVLFYKKILTLSKHLENRGFLEEYRKRNFILGKTIEVMDKTSYSAKAVDIDENGGLLIQTKDGNLKTLHYGEVSIKPL